ncbi:hypothetical protein CY35_06G009200 [Sphagnum magellanicum]|nr:hypothetical protein CY35_06G009200 [Sphagnum magellanicum]KAH9558444.1 hypothetical protein CY35_06G009200 [Sphagnum magellanicum]KAH9558445.1 hypothetical protein CY35_06G009200 [Sphagnum magellanicum]KAH9558446.1 hypothetical protein CY35_06G009200 [Sphagnum magellanicum]KAH9558447.1 hypothetical protein CY35_06G009200 [Sphagnum magellanicum]
MKRKVKWAAITVKEQFQACCSYEAVLAHVQDNEEVQEKDEDLCEPLGSMHISNVAKATSISGVSLSKAREPTGVDCLHVTLCKAPILVHGKSMITKIETQECEPTSLQTCNKISALFKEQQAKQQQLPVVLTSPMKLDTKIEQCFALPISQNLQNSKPHISMAPPKIEPRVIKASKDVMHNVDCMARTSKHGAQGIQQSQVKPISKQVLQKGTRPLGSNAQAFTPKDFGGRVSLHHQASPPTRLKKHVSGPLPRVVGISPTSRGIDPGATRSPQTHVPKLKHVSGPLPRTHVGVSQGMPHVGSPCNAKQFKTNKQQMANAPLGQLELMAILGSMKKPSKEIALVVEAKRNTKSNNTSNLGANVGKHTSSGTNVIHVPTCNHLQERGASQPTCVPPLTMLERRSSQGSGASRDQGERMHQVGRDVGDEEEDHARAQSVSTCMSRIEVQHDRKMQQQEATTSKEWNGSIRTAQDYQALLHNKQVAAMKRERALEYALLRQHWKTGSRSHKGTLQWSREDHVADKLGWVWSWLDRATHAGAHGLKNHVFDDSPDFQEQHSESVSVKSTVGVCTTDIGSPDFDYQGWKNSQEWPLSLRQQHAIGLLQSNQNVPRKSSPIQHKASISVSPLSIPTNNATPSHIEAASRLAKPPNLCQVCAQDIQPEETFKQHSQLGRQDVSTTSESCMSMESEASENEASKLRVQKLLNFLEESTKDDQESVGSCPGMGPSVYKQLTSPFVGLKMRSQGGGRQPTCVLQHTASISNSNKETLIEAQISVALSDDDSVGTTAASVQQPTLRL